MSRHPGTAVYIDQQHVEVIPRGALQYSSSVSCFDTDGRSAGQRQVFADKSRQLRIRIGHTLAGSDAFHCDVAGKRERSCPEMQYVKRYFRRCRCVQDMTDAANVLELQVLWIIEVDV